MTDRNNKGQFVTGNEISSLGGKARVKKGLSHLSMEKRREIALKGVEARRLKREQQRLEEIRKDT